MNTLMKINFPVRDLSRDAQGTFFGRTIEDVLVHDFFSSPSANIRQEENGFMLEIAVPGMSRKDITVQVDGAVMRITAQKQKNATSWNIQEFNRMYFQRSFTLPAEADTSRIQATCRNGLLTIRIGRIGTNGNHRIIKIQGEGKNATFSSKLSSWWQQLKEKAERLLTSAHLKNVPK